MTSMPFEAAQSDLLDVEESKLQLEEFVIDASEHSSMDQLTSLRESIRIHGHGLDYFEKAMESMQQISMVLTQAVPSGLLDTDIIDQFAYYRSIEFSNLLFCPSNLVTPVNVINISDDIDPLHVLRKKKRHWLVHTPDNVVHYMELNQQARDINSYRHTKTCFPHSIRSGQLVELEVSFGAVRSHGGHKLLCTLQSILILEQELAMNAWLKHTMTAVPVNVKTLKWKQRDSQDDEIDKDVKRVAIAVSCMNLDGPGELEEVMPETN
ncbi:hypothetical protein JAAARDRAFT_193451 [Jaapia argillacea MUCL 33604]|uniref:Uncharacterized protein n=1 Tax=Jaapia argillacea MUCL 33604 TaxID=933084 RepID=A0A067Q5W0_9AGAM|nr:hypothetical protein JAAARDRAFT_193451 [Jaapia argillacea MUCL 33604]